MKIYSRILVSISLLATVSFSGIITGVSVIINNEPITLYEIYKYSEQYKISRKESLDMLVRQKIEQSQIEKFHISADIFEVDAYIKNLAQKSGLTQYEFQDMLKKRGIKLSIYKEDLKKKIEKDKLYQKIYAGKLKAVEDKQLTQFYQENPEEFKIANSFTVSIYTAQKAQSLQAIKNNPMLKRSNVKVKKSVLKADKLNEKLKMLLNSTKEGRFTRIMTIQNTPTMFYIKEKNDLRQIPFEDVKKGIYRVISKQQESAVIKDYFEKLKSSASIVVVRSPS